MLREEILMTQRLLWLLVMVCFAGVAFNAVASVVPRKLSKKKCVQIYYDRTQDTQYYYGRTHALYLENLIGHFPNYQRYVIPIAKYQRGDLEKCAASLYLGTHYNSAIPEAFFQDFASTHRNVAWLGYGLWKFDQSVLKKIFGVSFQRLSVLNHAKKDTSGNPSFFKTQSYKGEMFTKFAQWREVEGKQRYVCAFEQSVLKIEESQKAEVLSWSLHSGTSEKVPYIIRSKNRFLVTESPFSFMTEDDRSLIFADLLFDILDEAPLYSGKKPAFFRLEDIHPRLPLWTLFQTADALGKHNIPWHTSLIPIFSDTEGRMFGANGERIYNDTIVSNPSFQHWLQYATKQGSEFILHGVTHQSGNYKNPWGISGDDFEFWDYPRNRALQGENAQDILDRLQLGWDLTEAVGIQPIAWLTPHYQASPLGYRIFADVFRWNVGRVTYFPDTVYNRNNRLPEQYSFSASGKKNQEKRLAALGELQADWPKDLLPSGQIFPYEIYGDYYGQRLIPEVNGNIELYMLPGVWGVRSLDQVVASMKRNRNLRDVWASFFWHSYYLEKTALGGGAEYIGDVRHIDTLVEAAKQYGYEFISLSEWNAKNTYPKAPATIEVR